MIPRAPPPSLICPHRDESSFVEPPAYQVQFPSALRTGLGIGAKFSALKASRTILAMISRVFFLSSAGTTYQGAIAVLVALRKGRDGEAPSATYYVVECTKSPTAPCRSGTCFE